MCVVVQHHLGKGSRCAPPLHPPGHGPDQGIEPIPSQQTVSPVNHLQVPETSLSTCTGPWIMGAIAPALNPTRKETSLSLHPST
jgi:hypothetical protein